MSLIEILTAMAVLSLLLSSIYLLLIYGLRARRQGEVYQTVHFQAELALEKVIDELRETNISSVVVGASPSHVIFLSLEDLLERPNRSRITYNGAGEPEWKKWVCFYRDETTNKLMRAELEVTPSSPATLPPMPVNQPLADFQASPTSRPVASNIEFFEVQPGSTLETLRVTVTARDMVNSDNATENNLSSEVHVRNS